MQSSRATVGSIALCLSGAAFGQNARGFLPDSPAPKEEGARYADDGARSRSSTTLQKSEGEEAELPARFSGALKECLPPLTRGTVPEDPTFIGRFLGPLFTTAMTSWMGIIVSSGLLRCSRRTREIKSRAFAAVAIAGGTLSGLAGHRWATLSDESKNGRLIKFKTIVNQVVETKEFVTTLSDGAKAYYLDQSIMIPESPIAFQSISGRGLVQGLKVTMYVRVDANNRVMSAKVFRW